MYTHWFLDPIRYQYADFAGTATREQFWKFTLSLTLLTLGGALLVWLTETVMVALVLVFWLTILLPAAALGVRRLHDAGYTGWLVLLPLVPYLGIVIFLLLCALPSRTVPNHFDRTPR